MVLVTSYIRAATTILVSLFIAQSMIVSTAWCQATDGSSSRVRNGLVVLYDFHQPQGSTVPDRADFREPLDLQIMKPTAVHRVPGVLEVREPTVIRSETSARKVVDAIRAANELTMEAWVWPANEKQRGPARLLTLSLNSVQRNATLGQDGDRFDARLRTTTTDDNGLPSLMSPTGSVATKPTHVVFTRRRTGHTRLYVNAQVVSEGRAAGELSNWNETFRLGLGDELSGQRAWLGKYYLVAIYRNALYPEEVQQNFAAGPGRGVSANVAYSSKTSAAPRIKRGLQLLYDFREAGGPLVHDQAQVGKPYPLRINDLDHVRRSADGLEVRSGAMIRSVDAVTRVSKAVRRSGRFTVEAWVRPATPDQTGPARIVSLSRDGSNRNFTLGQDSNRYDVRFRTTKTTRNGIPSLASPATSAAPRLTHIVYTRDRQGHTRMYVNGKQASEGQVGGDTSNWDDSFRLVMADEHTKDRQWLGTYRLVAIYSRDLTSAEVQQNYNAGPPAGATLTRVASRLPDPRAVHFETKIAPLISRHCLECHDSPNRQGGLDLSRRDAALAGGDTGVVITAGKANESLLWEAVESDNMPADRPALSTEEKALLKRWINDGATWSLEFIDPAIYAHQGDTTNWVQRLTVPEYIATVRDAVGVDIAAEARQLLPPDLRADGFSNTAYNLSIDLKHVDAYAQLAQIIVRRMDVNKFAAQFSSKLRFTDKEMGKLIAEMGKRILRGPLEEDEIISYRGISTSVAAAGGNLEEAVGLILEGMLQSPRFIYRMEIQRGDGGAWPTDDYELASRMSYIVWGAPPDDELLRSADDGSLDAAEVERQLERMFRDQRARQRSLQFATDWLNLGRLANLQPNPRKFPNWKPRLAQDMRDETLAFFTEVVWSQERPLADLLNAQFTFLTPELARHYGLNLTDDGDDESGLSHYDLSDVPSRGGLLTQGSILTVGGDEASMVTRGLFVMHDLLRGVVRDPPPCVDTTPTPSKPGVSQRAISEARIANESCGGCHAKFEPLAFGLEKFDGLGAFHEQDEHGNVLREDGEILAPGAAQAVKYNSSAELMNLLAGSDRVRESITWKLTQFALGRPLVAQDAATVAQIHRAAQEKGGKYTDVLTAIVMSDLVQLTRTEASK